MYVYIYIYNKALNSKAYNKRMTDTDIISLVHLKGEVFLMLLVGQSSPMLLVVSQLPKVCTPSR